MRNDILEYLQSEIYNRCQKPSNRFGIGCYYHIEAVVRNSALLADRYRADKEIVMIAAWLHDIASVTDYSLYEEHHLHGTVIAGELLTALQYDKTKIQAVQNCIRNHRGSVYAEKQSIEEICVADADAISHFDSVPSLLYLAYVERHMSIEDGIQFIRGKLERSFLYHGGQCAASAKHIVCGRYASSTGLYCRNLFPGRKKECDPANCHLYPGQCL